MTRSGVRLSAACSIVAVIWAVSGSPALARVPEACREAYSAVRAYEPDLFSYWNTDIPATDVFGNTAEQRMVQADACIAARGGSLDYGLRAELRRQAGDLAGAEADATRRVDMARSPAAHYQRGEIRLAARRWAEAVSDLERALAGAGEYEYRDDVRFELAIALAETGNAEAALAHARQAFASRVERFGGYLRRPSYDYLSRVYRALDMHDANVALWDEYIAEIPDDPEGSARRLGALYDAARYQEIVTATEGQPHHWSVYNYRAAALRELGRHQESADTYVAWQTWAESVGPRIYEPVHGLCFELTPLGRAEEALAFCQEALAWEGAGPVQRGGALRAAGVAYEALGQTDEAIRHYRLALTSPGAGPLTIERARASLAALGASEAP